MAEHVAVSEHVMLGFSHLRPHDVIVHVKARRVDDERARDRAIE